MRIILVLCVLVISCKAQAVYPEPRTSKIFSVGNQFIEVVHELEVDSANFLKVLEEIHLDMHGSTLGLARDDESLRLMCIKALEDLKELKENDLVLLRITGSTSSSDSMLVSMYWKLVDLVGTTKCWREAGVAGQHPLAAVLHDARHMRKLRLVEMGK